MAIVLCGTTSQMLAKRLALSCGVDPLNSMDEFDRWRPEFKMHIPKAMHRSRSMCTTPSSCILGSQEGGSFKTVAQLSTL